MLGTFTGEIIRLISNIRLKHGQSAVTFEGCGRLSLTHEFSNIADIIHIDLSDIKSLEGKYYTADLFVKVYMFLFLFIRVSVYHFGI